MKIEIDADEAKLILNHRAWKRLGKFKNLNAYYIAMSPILIVAFSVALLFIPNLDNVVPSVFLALGIIALPYTFKSLKRFKVLQTQIQAEMIAEENKNKGGL